MTFLGATLWGFMDDMTAEYMEAIAETPSGLESELGKSIINHLFDVMPDFPKNPFYDLQTALNEYVPNLPSQGLVCRNLFQGLETVFAKAVLEPALKLPSELNINKFFPAYKVIETPTARDVWSLIGQGTYAYLMGPAGETPNFVLNDPKAETSASFGPPRAEGWGCTHWLASTCTGVEPLLFGDHVKVCIRLKQVPEGDRKEHVWLGFKRQDGQIFQAGTGDARREKDADFGMLALEIMRFTMYYMPVCAHNWVHFGFVDLICGAQYVVQKRMPFSRDRMSKVQAAMHLHCIDAAAFSAPVDIMQRTFHYPRTEPDNYVSMKNSTDYMDNWGGASYKPAFAGQGWDVSGQAGGQGIALHGAEKYSDNIDGHFDLSSWLHVGGMLSSPRAAKNPQPDWYQDVPKYKCLLNWNIAYKKAWREIWGTPSIGEELQTVDIEFLNSVFEEVDPLLSQYGGYSLNQPDPAKTKWKNAKFNLKTMFDLLSAFSLQTSAMHTGDHVETFIGAEKWVTTRGGGLGKDVDPDSRFRARQTWRVYLRFNDGPLMPSHTKDLGSHYLFKADVSYMKPELGIDTTYFKELVSQLKTAAKNPDGKECWVQPEDFATSICF